MENNKKLSQVENPPDEQTEKPDQEIESLGRRDFLHSLNKWSKAVIGGLILGSLVPSTKAATWINNRGSWANRSGGGGGWINGSGGGGGGSWVNRRGY